MVYRRMLMGDSSQPAGEISVAPPVTYNLSPGSEATSPKLCGMRHIHSLCFPSQSVSLHLSEV